MRIVCILRQVDVERTCQLIGDIRWDSAYGHIRWSVIDGIQRELSACGRRDRMRSSSAQIRILGPTVGSSHLCPRALGLALSPFSSISCRFFLDELQPVFLHMAFFGISHRRLISVCTSSFDWSNPRKTCDVVQLLCNSK